MSYSICHMYHHWYGVYHSCISQCCIIAVYHVLLARSIVLYVHTLYDTLVPLTILIGSNYEQYIHIKGLSFSNRTTHVYTKDTGHGHTHSTMYNYVIHLALVVRVVAQRRHYNRACVDTIRGGTRGQTHNNTGGELYQTSHPFLL